MLAMFVPFALALLPKPLLRTDEGVSYKLAQPFDFAAVGGLAPSPLLQGAFTRYSAIMFRTESLAAEADTRAIISGCDVDVTSTSQIKTETTDESYTLHVKPPRIQIKAPTVFGAMYALETLSQLIYDTGTRVDGTLIRDSPRFAYRGTMIDTARHFIPLAALRMHVDAMAYAKLNVLHWHIVDGIAFPYGSEVLPSMSKDGSYSPKHIYSIADIKSFVLYAMARGVRIIPEFDTPGHVSRGWESLGVLTQCFDTSTTPPTPTNLGALNPTINRTYDMLSKLMAEVQQSFAPERFVHVGGDEVPKDCWQSNPSINRWLRDHPQVSGFAGLETYFEQRLLSLLQAQNSSYMAWQELFDNGATLRPDTVLEVWKGGGPTAQWQPEMARVTEAGFRSVLSAPFYLNYIAYGADWPKYYEIEPTNFTGGERAEATGLVHGVEACFWSEFIDSTNLLSRAWPRAAAVAERAWSAKSVTNLTDAERRLHDWRCRLLERGINGEPIGTCSVNAQRIGGPSLQQWCQYQVPGFSGFCPTEWEPAYAPPWSRAHDSSMDSSGR